MKCLFANGVRGAAAILRIVLLSSFCLFVLQGCAIKPKPVTMEEHQARVDADRQLLYSNQQPLSGPLTLEEAIARALTYNYDHRLAMMEAMFHNQQLTAASYAMLPKLALGAGYTNRDTESASSSISYKTRKETLEPSVSSEKERQTSDLTLTWNILDFGMSYFQAKQQADRVLIMQERKRRVVNNLVKEVIGAYWKAATAEQIKPKVDKALKDTERALRAYATLQKESLSSPLEALEQYRDLLAIASQLRRLQSDLDVSRVKLAALINIPLQQPFSIAKPDKKLLNPPVVHASLEELEKKGLTFRPDLREEVYQERIDKTEVHKEILRMMPGVSLFTGVNYDANKFLLNNYWAEAGARVTLNLFNLITGPQQIKAAKTRVEVAQTRRLALTVAALVQIHLSYHQYKQAIDEYKHSREMSRVENKILRIARSERSEETQSELDYIRRSVGAVRAEMDTNRTLSDVYQVWGNLYFSLGGDIVETNFEHPDLAMTTQLVKECLHRWWGGELPFDRQHDVFPHVAADNEQASGAAL